ncbi:hypothetical protein ACFX2I_046762 [Malus domestica]
MLHSSSLLPNGLLSDPRAPAARWKLPVLTFRCKPLSPLLLSRCQRQHLIRFLLFSAPSVSTCSHCAPEAPPSFTCCPVASCASLLLPQLPNGSAYPPRFSLFFCVSPSPHCQRAVFPLF